MSSILRCCFYCCRGIQRLHPLPRLSLSSIRGKAVAAPAVADAGHPQYEFPVAPCATRQTQKCTFVAAPGHTVPAGPPKMLEPFYCSWAGRPVTSAIACPALSLCIITGGLTERSRSTDSTLTHQTPTLLAAHCAHSIRSFTDSYNGGMCVALCACVLLGIAAVPEWDNQRITAQGYDSVINLLLHHERTLHREFQIRFTAPPQQIPFAV